MSQQIMIPGCTERTAAKDSDVKYTPASAVKALLDSDVPPPRYPAFCEPCAGNGAIIEAMSLAGYDCGLAIEVRPEERDNLLGLAAEVRIADALTSRYCWLGEDVIVTNPPFSLAHYFWAACVDPGPSYVAMLLRLNTLGSATWASAWNNFPPTALRTLAKRPSFTGDGKTDAAEYGWFIYRRGEEPMNLGVI